SDFRIPTQHGAMCPPPAPAGHRWVRLQVMSLVCARTEQPLDWLVLPANSREHFAVEPLLDSAAALGFRIEPLVGDRAYETHDNHDRIRARGIVPIIESGNRRTNDPRPPRLRARRLDAERNRLAAARETE